MHVDSSTIDEVFNVSITNIAVGYLRLYACLFLLCSRKTSPSDIALFCFQAPKAVRLSLSAMQQENPPL